MPMRSSVTIDRPLEDVFRFFLDLERNIPRTDPSVEHVIKTPPGPTEPATTFRLRQCSLGKTRETTTRFTAIERNRKLEFEGVIGPLRPECALAFEQTGTRTSVSLRGHSHPVGVLKPLSSLFDRKGQQIWRHRLERIKCLLETSGGESVRLSPGASGTPRATAKLAGSAKAPTD
ncbi:MAG: SRPBCC family protein [Solirubrobacteraceae bacterium]